MKKYKLNNKNCKWIEDSSFIGYSTYYNNGLSYFIIDIDTIIETRYKLNKFISYITPSKIVLKQYAHVDICIKTLFGKNSIQQDPFIIETLKILEYDKDIGIYTFTLIGDGDFTIYAMGAHLYIPEETVAVNGQTLYIPTKKRLEINNKYFKDGFFEKKGCATESGSSFK